MITLYIVCGLIGLVLALLAAVGAGHDLDHDVNVEVGDHEVHVEAGGVAEFMQWLPFLSLRFWTYAFLAFGLTGFLLTRFTSTASSLALWVAIGMGLLSGTLVALLVRLARGAESSSNTTTQDMLGAEGQVMVTIRGEQPGRIRCNIRGDIIDVLAVSDEPLPLEPGASVIIISVENDRARVIPRAALFDESQAVIHTQ